MRKWILEPIWNYKYDKGTLNENIDYQVIGVSRLIRLVKEKITNYKLKHLKLGKVKYNKYYDKDSFDIAGISWDISWQVDRYLAILIRDYIKFHIKNTPAIGNCVLIDNPEGVPYDDFLLGKEPNYIDYYTRWKDLALKVSDEFDELRIMLEKADSSGFSRERLQIAIDKAFKDLAYIYQDLGW